jgi:tetratricopeptide (TPR) repeat protein
VRRLAVVVCVLSIAAIAHARSPWVPRKKSIAPKEYTRAVAEGNYHLGEARRIALAHDVSGTIARPVHDHARAAIVAFERAIDLGPDDAELHFRAMQAALYIDDTRSTSSTRGLCAVCRDGYEAVVRHVDALRRLDPLDPREAEVAWNVALALSKLGGLGGPHATEYFERAIGEYARWRRLSDEANPDRAQSIGLGYSNCAEILMAVGHLEQAIAFYRASTEFNPNEALNWYGLAVALDRDGQVEKAHAAMREAQARDRGRRGGPSRLIDDGVFFVPEGDVFYYEALSLEVKGDIPNAVAAYNKYLTRAKASLYHARAKERLEELRKRAGN